MFGCRIESELEVNRNSIVYRGVREADQVQVILKVLRQERPSPGQIKHLKKEYELLKKLRIQGVPITFSFEKERHRHAIIFEDIGGDSLMTVLKNREEHKLTISEFLLVAIKTIEVLDQLHRNNVIHKDLDPSNIVWNKATGEVQIIDFGLSMEIRREILDPVPVRRLEGTLPYISPEQTGRMNRPLDYRTDFYSLGATFYELLTGMPPFVFRDAMELVHAHLVRIPTPPNEINPDLPTVISDIVLKLLEKNAEDRYQSASGILYDLLECRKRLDESGHIESFPPATQDVMSSFQLPQKLYGRESEVEQLTQTFNRVVDSGTCALSLITGQSGVGKTSIVQELFKPITLKRAYFIRGKFEQHRRDVPYFALIQAFERYIKILLSESEESLGLWKETFISASGTNAAIIADIIPELVKITGVMEKPVQLPPIETENRLKSAFEDFIGVCATQEHPLVLFLDDLQWGDLSSIKLIKTLIERNSSYLHLVGAYRENEVEAGHPLLQVVDELKNHDIKTLYIQPLNNDNVDAYLSDLLLQPRENVGSLRDVLIDHTEGNPFFLQEFIKNIYNKGLLEFNPDRRVWTWDNEIIRNEEVTENVVDLLVSRIRDLPEYIKKLITFASCAGFHFSPKILQYLAEEHSDPLEVLQAVLNEGIFIKEGSPDEDFAEEDNPATKGVALLQKSYRFAHDRILQAAYSLLDEDKKKEIHYSLALAYRNELTDEQFNEHIHDVVRHFYIARDLLDETERKSLPGLLLKAGERARESAAWDLALHFLLQCLDLLGENPWSNNYSLSLKAHEWVTESYYLLSDFESSNQYITKIFENTRSEADNINAYAIRIKQLENMFQIGDGLQTVIHVLKSLGITFPENPTMENVIQEIHKVIALLEGRSPLTLLDQKIMEDKIYLQAAKIVQTGFYSIMYSFNMIGFLIEIMLVEMFIKHGNSPNAPTIYARFGIHLNHFAQNHELASQFGELALQLATKAEFRPVMSGTYFLVASQLFALKQHVRGLLPLYMETYHAGIETGNIDSALLALASYPTVAYYAGMNLSQLQEKIKTYTRIIEKYKHSMALMAINQVRQFILKYTTVPFADDIVQGEFFNETEEIPVLLQMGQIVGVYYFYLFKITLLCHFQLYDKAVQLCNEPISTTLPLAPYQKGMYYMFDSLARLGTYEKADGEEKADILNKVKENQKILRGEAELAPMNNLHHYNFIEAELALVTNDPISAIQYYHKAISDAVENGHVSDEALIYERLALYYHKQEQNHFFRHFLRDAYYAYLKWGAHAKIRDLENRYPEDIQQIATQDMRSTSSGTWKTTMTSSDPVFGSLDFISVLKASQSISGEIVLDRLLKNLLDLLIENVGAQQGWLIIQEADQWFIETYHNTSGVTAEMSERINLFERNEFINTTLPLSIILYVIRTKESLILGSSTMDDRFRNDPYIVRKKPKSILCHPLMNQGNISGVVYLENNLMTDAFTPQRMEVLNFLSTQAAISLDNARLYNNITDLNRAYERFVPREFLSFLEKKSIVDVKLGDQVQREMTILFSDIRDFTTISELMTPEENFAYVNRYLSAMEPVITEYKGFIDKYIGDAVMALFPHSADDALSGAIQMLKTLETFNQDVEEDKRIRIGIGLHTGSLMLGTVGGHRRMDSTVISTAVNTAARVEGLTKQFGVSLLITTETFNKLIDPLQIPLRMIGRVRVKGKQEPDMIFEVYGGDNKEQIKLKTETKEQFEKGVQHFLAQEFTDAEKYFLEVFGHNPEDKPAYRYLQKTSHYISHGVPEDWEVRGIYIE